MEYYSPIKRYGILTCATMWINLENIMLRESSQIQSPHLYEVTRVGKCTETESRPRAFRDGRKEGIEGCLPGMMKVF